MAAPLISVHQLQKGFGQRILFAGLSFGLHTQQRLALLGPNGAGKSTLLKILAGLETPDQGDVTKQSQIQVIYVPQEDNFVEALSALQVAVKALARPGLEDLEVEIQSLVAIDKAGLPDPNVQIAKLSGGQRKRLALSLALSQESDVLLLDEPTNHLDWEGILELEGQLKNYRKTLVVISHDREFLKNQCQEFMEINPGYPKGYFAQVGSYQDFLERREEFLSGEQSRQARLANKVRRETEWLRAGVKARTTKSVSRSQKAHEMIDDLGEMKSRQGHLQRRAQISIESAGKQSKQFYDLHNLSIHHGERVLLDDLTLRLGPGQALGLLGANGSGKTSLVRVLAGMADNFHGTLKVAEGLQITYLDQNRESLNPALSPKEFLADGSEYVNFAGQSVHVFSYAAKFLLNRDQLEQPIGRLSGGERARLLIAKILLQPADVFILDEPTNDLDLNTIEILEDSLQQFPGLVILVSHDRYFLRQVCQRFLALNGDRSWTTYADLDQWLSDTRSSKEGKGLKKDAPQPAPLNQNQEQSTKPLVKVKLSYKEKRALETIEQDIAKAEERLAKAQAEFSAHSDFADHRKTQDLSEAVDSCQGEVERLYQLWQDLEQKTTGQ